MAGPYGNPQIRNSIIWGNVTAEISGVDATVSYCDIRGGWAGENNININPAFIDPANQNYNLCAQSECIDAGDPDLLDPDGTRSDIGAYYPEHPVCSSGIIRHVSVLGNDSTGDGSSGNPYGTIQHAIDRSKHLDTVLAAPGTYIENLALNIRANDNSVVLVSEYAFSHDRSYIEQTIIDGGLTAPVIDFQSASDHSVVKGFTIRRGLGAGVRCVNTSPILSSNIIERNDGNGVFCLSSDAFMERNVIRDNASRLGGGIYVQNSSPRIVSNLFERDSSGSGGAIYSIDSEPTIEGNGFAGNVSDFGGAVLLHKVDFRNFRKHIYKQPREQRRRRPQPMDIPRGRHL